jgi:NADPH-dependent ferric siderophore reductase
MTVRNVMYCRRAIWYLTVTNKKTKSGVHNPYRKYTVRRTHKPRVSVTVDLLLLLLLLFLLLYFVTKLLR